MENTEKHMDKMEKKRARPDTINILDKLPHELICKILSKLDVESLCVSASVSRPFRLSVSLTISSLSSLDLTEFSPRPETVDNLLRNNRTIQCLKLDCCRLDDSSIYLFLKEGLQELVLLRCIKFSTNIITAIGEKCPKLRILMLEVRWLMMQHPQKCIKAIEHMVNGCMLLESLNIQFPNLDASLSCFKNHKLILSKRIKTLFLDSIMCEEALLLIPMLSGLQSLTLVVDKITDELLVSVSQNLPNLTELCLKDKPLGDVPLNHDLSNSGILAICACRNLKRLSLTRGGGYRQTVYFKQVDDVGILQLAKELIQLEFVRLAGFYNLTDVGYTFILLFCKRIRRYEIENANSLTDLAFHDLANNAPRCLVEVRLNNCYFLTSEAAVSLSFCKNLKVLDLSGCVNIEDLGLKAISKLCKLVKLDVSGADITDDGLSTLSVCSSPIASLSLRECRRITSRGMLMLFNGESSMRRALTTLDISHMSAVSDRVVATISEHCGEQLTSLSIRDCYHVSDDSIKALGLKTVAIRRLDLFNCCALSSKAFEYLRPPLFNKLRWLGVGGTVLRGGRQEHLSILSDRRGLSVCVDGCKMYCDV